MTDVLCRGGAEEANDLLASIFPSMIDCKGGVRGSGTRAAAMKQAMEDLLANHRRTNYGLLLHRALKRMVSYTPERKLTGRRTWIS